MKVYSKNFENQIGELSLESIENFANDAIVRGDEKEDIEREFGVSLGEKMGKHKDFFSIMRIKQALERKANEEKKTQERERIDALLKKYNTSRRDCLIVVDLLKNGRRIKETGRLKNAESAILDNQDYGSNWFAFEI